MASGFYLSGWRAISGFLTLRHSFITAGAKAAEKNIKKHKIIKNSCEKIIEFLTMLTAIFI